MSLQRFHDAQADSDSGFKTALAEMRSGRKRKHWIWYIFPQLAGLGRSGVAQYYGIQDLEEACEYFGELGLSAAGLSFDEQRLPHLASEKERRGDRFVGDIADALHGFQQ